MPDITDFLRHLQSASQWRCECGQQCDPTSSQWRWNGEDWEHSHSYPMGHVTAVRESPPSAPESKP